MGNRFAGVVLAAFALLLLCTALPSQSSLAQEQVAAADASADAATAPEPLTADEMEVLVARIALYPDELVAVITGASLYPLQIVEAARYLDQYAKDKSLKPKESWDGSVISLLNYPEVVKMMSDDLEWTQALGDAIAYQQKDVLIAIQQLRDEAVAKGVIKTDDKIQVVKENDNVVIKSASPEVIYVPQYEPEMLYEPDYAWEPISYYPDPYPNYWYPGATFFAGAVTGAIWAAAVDWDDWGVWGGQLGRRRHRHRLQQLLQQPRLQRQGQLQRRRLEERRPQQDQHRSRPAEQVRPQRDQEQGQGEHRQLHPRPRQGHQEARQHRQQAAGRGWRGNAGRPQEHARWAEGPGRPGGQSAPGNRPAAGNRPNRPDAGNRPASRPSANRPANRPATAHRPAGKPKPAA